MFDDPAIQYALNSRVAGSIPFETIGSRTRRAGEADRDNAAMALAMFLVHVLNFAPDKIAADIREDIQKRINKVRQSQGNGDVAFVNETAAKIKAAAEQPT